MNKLLRLLLVIFIITFVFTETDTVKETTNPEQLDQTKKPDIDELIKEELLKLEINDLSQIENLDLFYNKETSKLPVELQMSKEELYVLLNLRTVFYADHKIRQLYHGNFNSFMELVYKKNLPLYLTADPILYALNENLRLIQAVLGENYIYPILTSFYINFLDKLNLIDIPELKYSIRELRKYFAIVFSVMTKNIELEEEIDFPVDIPQAIYKDTIDAIKEARFMHIMSLFGNFESYDFSEFKPKGVFGMSNILLNTYHILKWFKILKFNNINNIQVVWIISKIIVDSGVSNYYKALNAYMKYFFEGEDVQIDFLEIYEIANTIGIKDYLLTEEQKANLHVKLTKPNNDNMFTPMVKTQMWNDNNKKKTKTKDVDFTLLPQTFPINKWFFDTTIKGEKLITSISEYAYSILNIDTEIQLLKFRADLKPNSKKFLFFRDGLDNQALLDLVKDLVETSMKDETNKWRTQFHKHYLMILQKLNTSVDPINKNTNRSGIKKSKMGFTTIGSLIHLESNESHTLTKIDPRFSKGEIPDIHIEPNTEFFDEIELLLNNVQNIFEKVDDSFPQNKFKAEEHIKVIFKNLRNAIDLLRRSKINQDKGVVDLELFNELKNIVSTDGNGYNGWYLNLFNIHLRNIASTFMNHDVFKYEFNYNRSLYGVFNGSITLEFLNYNKLGLRLVPKIDKNTGLKVGYKIMIFSTYNPLELDHTDFKMSNDDLFNNLE